MFKYIKYLNPIVLYALAIISFTNTGLLCWLVLIYSWVFVPLLELFINPNTKNLTAAEEELSKNDKLFDYMLYLIVFLQIPTLFFFFYSFTNSTLNTIDIIGRITAMGMLCGTFGINVAHELGHRKNKFEQALAKISLLSSLYMHFFIEHNKGHHKNVATPNDPSSARYNEWVYVFYFRTIIFSYLSAWHIANDEMKKKNLSVFNLKNEMLQVQIIQVAFVTAVYIFFGGWVTVYFLAAAFMGILLLETVNYIEHYGLQRKPTIENKFERTMPEHSWNSNHVIGRLLLFELSRHSDHHYLASRKYQILKHHDNAPQLPTGYPGSMLLALVPPLWCTIMNKKIAAIST
ncbi:MAG: alkane 1-monooxygenase [Ferruginibacter sp.]|nr:alkane 1-monooxygenase [Ferruginibacter sp.]